ncbi:hypothetical protein J6590_093856 [Homalodisca vitripennis]|nr:hypothetical protein J6590_093856 [Homalodisca vitripennis]
MERISLFDDTQVPYANQAFSSNASLGDSSFKHSSLWDSLLFDDYPYFKKFFKSAIGNFDDPFMSPRFQKHMLQVLLPTFGGIMDNLDFPEAVNEAVKRLAVAHRRKEIGLAKEHIDILGQVILSIIKRDVLDCTEEQEEAMKKVLSIVVGMFCEALEGRTF